MENIHKTLKVYKKVNRLKDIDRIRRGWMVRNIEGRLESVAEHCFAMANLAILLDLQFNLNLDMLKVLKMINIHEYGEVKCGDIIPKDGIPSEEKYDKELLGITELMDGHPGQTYIIELWKEFEQRKTKEAIFVSLLDKFQSVLQAEEYSKKYNRPEIFQEFNDYYLQVLKDRNIDDASKAVKLLRL